MMETPGLRVKGRWGWLLAPWAAAMLLLCLTPVTGDSPRAPSFCILCGDWALRDLIGNVFLYVPLGFGLRRKLGSLGPVVAAGLLLSLGVELAQLAVPGRLSALGDLLANTAGTWAGGSLGANPRGWVFPRDEARRRLQLLWGTGAPALILASGLLLTPSIPEGGFFGNWTPQVGSLAPYQGRLISASLGGYDLPSERLEDPERVRSALESDDPLVLRFLVGPTPDEPAPFFRLIGEGQREVIRIDVEGSSVLVRPRYEATRLRLSRPELRFQSAMDGLAPGETAALSVQPGPEGGTELRVNDQAPVVEGLTPARGWVVLSNIDNLRPSLAWVADFVWGLMLFFPIGWWAPTLGRLVSAAAPALVSAAVVPTFSPLLTSPFGHYLLAAGFALVGHLLSRLGYPHPAGGMSRRTKIHPDSQTP